jgi:hypothetical protein
VGGGQVGPVDNRLQDKVAPVRLSRLLALHRDTLSQGTRLSSNLRGLQHLHKQQPRLPHYHNKSPLLKSRPLLMHMNI